MPRSEWQDSYLHLQNIKIDSHDDDVGHKFETGRKHEGGAEGLEKRDSHWRSLGENFHLHKPQDLSFPQCCALASVRQASALNSYRALRPISRRFWPLDSLAPLWNLRVVRCKHRFFWFRLSGRVYPGLIGRLRGGAKRTLPQLGSRPKNV